MFIIVPKKPATRPATTASPQQEVQAGTPPAPAPENGHEREPTRAAAACDSCRGKKIKCNGQRPCAKCQQKGIICAYSRPAQRETQVSVSQAAVLRSQQRRLCAAAQQMASTIARYEEGVERSPASFEISQLLEKFAPEPYDGVQSAPAKRPAEYQLTPDSSSTRPPRLDRTAPNDPTALSPSTTYGSMGPAELPFELQPAPNWSGSPEQWHQQYQTMMQFLQTYSGASGGRSWTPTALSGFPPASGAVTIGSAHQPQPSDSTQQLMHLVDWNRSLQNLQTSFNPSPPPNPAQYLDPALAGSTNVEASQANIDPQLDNGAT